MRTLILEGVMTALSSISHIGDTHGINAKLRREKIVQVDGSIEEVPVISGNSLRGILRDRGMLHMLRCLGYGVNEETGEVRGLSLAAFYFLFSGGALESAGGQRGLDIDEARKWRETIPLVSLFGGAMGNQIMPGKLKVEKALPICRETAHLIPPRFLGGKAQESIWEMTQEESYTRRDDEKNEPLRQLLTPETRLLLEEKAAGKREKAKSGDNQDVDIGQHQQMRYFVETLAAGTQLFWGLTLDDVSDLELEAACACLSEFSRLPYIGGKSGVGHGKVAIHFDQWLSIDTRVEPRGQALAAPMGSLYAAYLVEHGERIREVLGGLS